MNDFTDPDLALRSLAGELQTTALEQIPLTPGRVLAEPVGADRDSPAIDVSAMDGYAIRLQDLQSPNVTVSGEMQPGQPPLELPRGTACRIFTGAAIPLGAEAVVIREDTDESVKDQVTWQERAKQTTRGANIRVQGENGRAGETILDVGILLTAAHVAAAVNFGAVSVKAFQRVRVCIIVTGNELLEAQQSPEPWQLRDSNGPTIAAVCSSHPWLQCSSPRRCPDHLPQMASLLRDVLLDHDAVIFTGGVSKGDHDHVPAAISAAGAKTIFHRLPIRPGRPILGAATASGKLILGLPGNPVSAAVNMVRFGIPLLLKQSGAAAWLPTPQRVRLSGNHDKTLPLHWFRLVHLRDSATAELVESRGSGDLVSLSRSTGFIHQPPGNQGPGPWEYFPW